MNERVYDGEKRLSIHPILDPLLTNSYHLRYGGLFLLYTQNELIRNNLKQILEMNSNNLVTSLVSSAEDNSRSSAEIIRHQFILSCGVDKSAQSDNLLSVLKKTLAEAGYNEDKIQETLSEFTDKNLTVGGYFKMWEHEPLAKAMGFPCIQAFRAFQRENLSVERKSKQRLELKISTRHLLANLKNCDNFSNDTPRETFFNTLKCYVKKIEKKETTNSNIIKIAGEEGLETLGVIQQNCLFLARACLASEDHPQTLSLRAYDRQETSAKMYFLHKNITKASKIMNSSNTPINLMKNSEDLPISYNCFLCPSSAGSVIENDETDEPDKTNRPKIIDKTRAQFNAFRLLPLQTSDDVRAHMQKFHSVAGAVALARSEPHSKLYVCNECPPENREHSLTCCPLHMEDHLRLVHYDTKIHFRLLRSFRNACKVKCGYSQPS